MTDTLPGYPRSFTNHRPDPTTAPPSSRPQGDTTEAGGMEAVKFVQYLRPDGRKTDVTIDRPRAIAQKAALILAAGYVLACEAIPAGMVCLTIEDPHQEEDVAVELCPNGSQVPNAVDRLVENFYAKSNLGGTT